MSYERQRFTVKAIFDNSHANGQKTLWKKEKRWLPVFFLFPKSVLKDSSHKGSTDTNLSGE